MLQGCFHFSLVAVLLLPTISVAAADAIQQFDAAKPDLVQFRGAVWSRPIVVRTEKDAEKYFSRNQLAKVQKSVDFKRQVLLLFVWQGSGQDSLKFDVLESKPEQIVFKLRRGRTRNLRRHVQAYVLRSDVKWTTGERSGSGGRPLPGKSGEYIKLEIRGRLNSQVAAIGGETTGVVIRASGATLELDLGNNPGLNRKAREFHDKNVLVRGTLSVRRGVEIRQRWIVAVTSLELANAPRQSGYLQENGSLRRALTLRDSQSGFAGETGHILTIEPDGAWRYQTFLNKTIRKPEHQGKLSSEELRGLAAQLLAHDLLGLPVRMGEDPGVNPHVITITFGDKQSAMILRGGDSPPKSDSKNSPPQRFAALVQAIQRRVKGM